MLRSTKIFRKIASVQLTHQPLRPLSTTSTQSAPKKAKKGGKGGAKGGGSAGGFSSETVTDGKILQSTVVGLNYFNPGEAESVEVELKPDDHYPDWLWEMDTKPKFLPEHFEEGTAGYYKALEESNFHYKTEANRGYQDFNDERFDPFYNYAGPLETQFIKNDPEGELANKIYDLELKYLNSKNTRKSNLEVREYDPTKPFVKLNMASLPSSLNTRMHYGDPVENVPKGDNSWYTFKSKAIGKKGGGKRARGKIGRF